MSADGSDRVVAVRVIVRGVVQGVSYRETMRSEADAAGVSGWVRNLADGRVEALLEGSHDGVDALVSWCRRGPRGAVVTDVEVLDVATSGAQGFGVRRD